MAVKKNLIGSAVKTTFVRRSINEQACSETEKEYVSHAPYDNPVEHECVKNMDENSDKIEHLSVRFIELSPLQQKVFLKLKELQGEKRVTEPVYMEEFSEKLDCPISSLKKAIQRLEKTGGIKREKFKHGRGGWTIYSVSTQVELESN